MFRHNTEYSLVLYPFKDCSDNGKTKLKLQGGRLLTFLAAYILLPLCGEMLSNINSSM